MERKSVRKMVTILAFSVMCLTLVSVPAVSAQPNKPLRCEVEFELIFVGEVPDHWEGPIWGDIVGYVTVALIEASFSGITEHFKETWEIVTDVGSIEIYLEGVWSFKTFKFKANGMVTAATGDWAYLVDADVHVRGVTSPFPGEPPIIATAYLFICGYAD